MKTLEPDSLPLASINLIEASAGTGKSWTVTYLYLRLILEKNLTVDQILVVTFTDAATKELRDDIRNRIADALHAFECAAKAEGYSGDDEYTQLIDKGFDIPQAIRQLKRAKLSLDEAAIFTIHSFCQRTLSENAFAAALPFESELMQDSNELMQQLTGDFWRRFTANAPQSLVFKLHQKSVTPDSLLNDVKNTIGKPYLKICGPQTTETTAEKWQQLENSYVKAIEIWRKDSAHISQLLNDPELEKHYYIGLVNNRDKITKEIRLYAMFDRLPYMLDLKSMKWLGTEPKLKKTAKREPIEHAFFQAWQDFLDLWTEIDANSDDFLSNTRIELIQYLQKELPKEKQRLGVLSFDDLLLQLQKTLQTHPELAADLRKKYRAALIDEFQDTDPIQYDIFHSMYNDPTSKDNAVFFVGDPKQAIYSFRGGDIHTYLKAKADTQTQHTLTKNWRSHADLIAAFNTLYAISDNPFKDEDIDYVAVDAGTISTDKVVTTQSRLALNFWQYEFEDEKTSAPNIRKEIATSIAGDIAQLLNDGQQGKAKIGDKAISGGDIAILIRSHNQADTIKSALNQRGIPSVQNSRDSIYATHEANELIYLLKALLMPQQEDEVRRALVTDFMAYKGTDLVNLQNDSHAWEDILVAMQNWHQQWKKNGFLPMMRSLMQDENTHQRLLSYANGERRISNILQLSELIHQAARNNMLGMSETLCWLQKQQLNASSNETELRLESDEDLVKIVTIHKSKGLEYPIVYCPYVGMSGRGHSDKVFSFNKENTACLEVGSAQNEAHKALKKAEESAEDTRLLYVALTRAKYQCNVVCFSQAIYNTSDHSALGWLLSNGLKIPSGSTIADNKAKADFFAAIQQNLHALATSGKSISVTSLPKYPASLRYQNTQIHEQLSARNFAASIKEQEQITSFSGLTAGAHDETPDYDAIAELKTQLVPVAENEFPRGATAGTALHEIFEHIDFVEAVNDQLEWVDDILDKYGFEKRYQSSAVQLIQQTLNATLVNIDQNRFALKQLTKAQRLDEMEFYLPLERLHIEELQQILYQHLPTDSAQGTQHWQTIRDAISALYFEEVEGFLKGFIDLIFEHEGKYYLADYKSNSLNDYGETALFEAMAHSHYYLQYLFYSVALHRYLKQRIPDYSWETHIGGAYYLFIRGMKPDIGSTTSANNVDIIELDVSKDEKENMPKKGGGVFFDKPRIELIEALDNLFLKLEIAC